MGKNEDKMVSLSIMELPYYDLKKKEAEDKAFQYIEDFISFNSEIDSKVFLNRTLKDKSLDNVIVQNELECKICIATFKMFYVEDTEDFLFKIKKKSPPPKKKTLKKWTEKKLKEMGTDLKVKVFE
jgi:paired amphipathic helix protein Sin3a